MNYFLLISCYWSAQADEFNFKDVTYNRVQINWAESEIGITLMEPFKLCIQVEDKKLVSFFLEFRTVLTILMKKHVMCIMVM